MDLNRHLNRIIYVRVRAIATAAYKYDGSDGRRWRELSTTPLQSTPLHASPGPPLVYKRVTDQHYVEYVRYFPASTCRSSGGNFFFSSSVDVEYVKAASRRISYNNLLLTMPGSLASFVGGLPGLAAWCIGPAPKQLLRVHFLCCIIPQSL